MASALTVPGWLEGLNPLLAVILAGLIPGMEPRYAVMLGIYLGLNPVEVLVVGLAEVLLLSLALSRLVLLADPILARIPRVGPLYSRYRSSALRRARPSVERWGGLGLVIFVAIPLPATGIYTGAVAGMLLGLPPGRLAFYLALGGSLSIGITMAATLLVS